MGTSHPICSLLERLNVVTPPQLALARKQSVSADLDDVLDLLAARQSAWWYHPRLGGPKVPALTEYQLKQIRKHSSGAFRALENSLRLKNYLLLKLLGKGGMGVVHQAWDLDRERFVAIKRVRSDSADLRRRFRRERKVLERLDHPRIARLYDVVRAGKREILIMEYLNHGSLTDRFGNGRKPAWKDVARWGIDLLDALEHAHERDVLHRDIKPSNILFHRENNVAVAKLADLGLAKCREEAGEDSVSLADTRAGQVLGSFPYMAPEQWKGAQHIERASDIYSLGATLYHALAGEPPFPVKEFGALCLAHQNTPPPSIIERGRADIPPEMDLILRGMLAKNPAQRGSPAILRACFKKVLETASAPAPAPALSGSATGSARGKSRGNAPIIVEDRPPSAPIITMPRMLMKPTDDTTLFSSVSALTVASWVYLTAPKKEDRPSAFSPAHNVRRHWRQVKEHLAQWASHPMRFPVRTFVAAGLGLAAVAGLVALIV